ncbi:3-oxo-5-alpha-steroid 4-dehydrogenase family protein, putative isoform 2 [Hibiscus syriacus]|uniref:3-oxo-5-alpha-steroid 4-dehydrogenase family protein, putative isoform 2 n=1 Tax=Hibiscus syriacus TaxID=106335 RepID=A0A6A3C2M3_HIBSY|nr:3-oxo-5-alpha-steroid 4-dehydrogenase family protein, putative isoform 2 [Hibiscus syriacus]
MGKMNLLGVLMETIASQSMDTIKTGLIWPLRAAWIAGILPLLIASLPSPHLNPFHALLQAFASSNRFTVPQSFFLHFYMLGVVWTTTLLMSIWYFAYKVTSLGSEPLSHVAAVSHLTGGRLYETFHVFNYSTSARMHTTGIYYYTAAPLSLCTICALEAFNFAADQVAEFKVKGQEMLSITDFDLWGYVKPITRLGWCQWAGAAIFSWGWFHQFCCHAILRSLRERGDRTEYVIPHGDWFEIVSSPHYLVEMIIYAGLLVASGGTDITICLLIGFVVANLAFTEAETHRWYLQKFEDYPQNWWAIVPYVY